MARYTDMVDESKYIEALTQGEQKNFLELKFGVSYLACLQTAAAATHGQPTDRGVSGENVYLAVIPNRFPLCKKYWLSIVAGTVGILLVLFFLVFPAPPRNISGQEPFQYTLTRFSINRHNLGMIEAQELLLHDLLKSWNPPSTRSTVFIKLTYDGAGNLQHYELTGGQNDQIAGSSVMTCIANTPLRIRRLNPALKHVQFLVRFDSLPESKYKKHVGVWISKINDQTWVTAMQPFAYSKWIARTVFHDSDGYGFQTYEQSLTGTSRALCPFYLPSSFVGEFSAKLVHVYGLGDAKDDEFMSSCNSSGIDDSDAFIDSQNKSR